MGNEKASVLQTGLVVLDLAAWAIAGLIFGNSNDYNQIAVQGVLQGGAAMSPAVGIAPNTKAGLGALGFALAGGLCFLGAAIAEMAHAPARNSPLRAEQGAPADRPRD